MYIDPNTGGMLFQILAVFFGIFTAVVLFFSGRIRIVFAKLRRQIRERARPETEKLTPEDKVPPPAA